MIRKKLQIIVKFDALVSIMLYATTLKVELESLVGLDTKNSMFYFHCNISMAASLNKK